MKLKRLTLAMFALAALVFLPAAAQADPLVFNFENPVLNVAAGGSVTFRGIATNPGTGGNSPVTIIGIVSSLNVTGITFDDTPFFANFDNRTVNVGQTLGPLDIFTIAVANNVAAGTYLASLSVTYNGLMMNQTATQDFRIVVGNQTAPIPEPTTMVLLGTGLAGAVMARRRRRQSE